MAERAQRGPSIGELTDGRIALRALHRSERVAMYDVRCRVGREPPRGEELSVQHHLVFPRSGVFVRHVNGREIVADANHVLFFQRDEVYRVSHPASCGDDCTVLAFDESLLLEAARACAPEVDDHPERPFARTHALSDARIFHLHERLRQYAASSAPSRLAVDEACIELLLYVLRRSRDGASGRNAVSGARERGSMRASTRELHAEQVRRAKLALATRAADDLSLAEIARAAHASEFHLARLFRLHTGLTLHQYRTRLRLHTALARLASGERDLAALALSLGFASHSHFSDTFARCFGVPPSTFRSAISPSALVQLSKVLQRDEQ